MVKKKKYWKNLFSKSQPNLYTLNNWAKSGLSVIENDFGVVFKRVVNYPLEHKHGLYKLGAFYEAIEKWENSSFEHPYSLSFDEDILFFDTETTGLKGVGTQIFLIRFT